MKPNLVTPGARMIGWAWELLRPHPHSPMRVMLCGDCGKQEGTCPTCGGTGKEVTMYRQKSA